MHESSSVPIIMVLEGTIMDATVAAVIEAHILFIIMFSIHFIITILITVLKLTKGIVGGIPLAAASNHQAATRTVTPNIRTWEGGEMWLGLY